MVKLRVLPCFGCKFVCQASSGSDELVAGKWRNNHKSFGFWTIFTKTPTQAYCFQTVVRMPKACVIAILHSAAFFVTLGLAALAVLVCFAGFGLSASRRASVSMANLAMAAMVG